ncbi:MAG: FAD-binding oxidoreductase [Bacteroidetes bacterium]|nr:MAG: FAD-binding oxidoreductase [Bacteroidota bacterium]
MSEKIIQALEEAIGAEHILTGEEVAGRLFQVWVTDRPLEAKAVIFPRTTAHVSEICRIAYQYNQTIVVHGGLTNLVGATAARPADLVVSMEKMDAIEEVDPVTRTMTVQAGAILENIQSAAREEGLLFPLNFGAKGSAQAGGFISTNAGGLRVLRFGMTRNLVLGLEVVLPDGTVLSSLKKIIKDNSGYDLKQLFIGAEGTLGIVTRAVFRLQELPKSRNSAFVGCRDFDQVIRFLKFADQNLAGALSGFELIWGDTYRDWTSPPSPFAPPLPHGYAFYVLMETLGADPDKDRDTLYDLLEKALETDLILDGAPAQTESDLRWFWNIREDVAVLNGLCQNAQHFDISLPVTFFGSYVEGVKEKLAAQLGLSRVYAFGHLADGNIHFIISKPDAGPELRDRINEIVYRPLQALGGSVSAEHGIGLDKKAWLPICRTPAEIETMKLLKKTFDPKGLLNPGRIFD